MPKGIWKPLTQAQIGAVKKDYLEMPVKTLAAQIGITSGRVMTILKNEGLVIPVELIEARKRASRFSKGHNPFNKGKKQLEYMSPESIERTKKTRFYKGKMPHNTKFNGHEYLTKDGYVMQRVSVRNYQLKHRLVYETAYGEIPEDGIVVFKDGDRTNCDLENLKLLSREENMLRNSKMNFPKELVPSMGLISQINKKIKSHGKK